jgi:hypothetical protein
MKQYLKVAVVAAVFVAASLASAADYQLTMVMAGNVQSGTLFVPKIKLTNVTGKVLAQLAGYAMQRGDTIEAAIDGDGDPGEIVVRLANGTAGIKLADLQWLSRATDGKTKVVGTILITLVNSGSLKGGQLVLTATVHYNSKGEPLSVTGDIRGYVGLVDSPNIDGNIVIKSGTISTRKVGDSD